MCVCGCGVGNGVGERLEIFVKTQLCTLALSCWGYRFYQESASLLYVCAVKSQTEIAKRHRKKKEINKKIWSSAASLESFVDLWFYYSLQCTIYNWLDALD